MISVWWLIPAFFAGALIGVIMMGLCCANDTGTGRKWWEDE